MSGRTTVNIDSYVVDDDVTLSDDLFNIAMGATLVLLGEDALIDDAISGPGRVSVRGPTTVDDGLTLSGASLFVDMSMLTENGGDMVLGQSSGDVVTARNILGATWDLVDEAEITGSAASQFVNLGLLEISATDYQQSTIAVDFYDRGGTVDVQQQTGELRLTGAVERFVGGVITGAGTLAGDDVVLNGASISSGNLDFIQASIVGDVVVSSSSIVGNLSIVNGSVLDLTNSHLVAADISGVGDIILSGTNSIVANNSDFGENYMQISGGVTLINNGETTFNTDYQGEGRFLSIYMTLQPGPGKPIAIENKQGATLTIDGDISGPTDGSATLYNYGTLDAEGGEVSSFPPYGQSPAGIGVDVVNDGAMTSNGGFLFGASVTGVGTLATGLSTSFNGPVGSGQTVEIPTSLPANYYGVAQFGTLTLNDVQDFAALITGFAQNGATGDQLVVNTATWMYQDFVANGSGTGGALMFADGSTETAVYLSGSYSSGGFSGAVSGSTTTITYSPATIQL